MTGGNVPQRRDLLDEMLHMISCKAAVKAGDRLTPDEITSLLQQRHYYRDTHHCPHGRPTVVRVPREDVRSFLEEAQELNIKGLSVTIPHKEAVLPMLTKADNAVQGIGACNTILFDEAKRDAFHASIVTYLPGLAKESLHPDMCGIRPKLQGPGEDVRDFVISEEGRLGLPGWVNLVGIESPGLTACMAIARRVSELVRQIMG